MTLFFVMIMLPYYYYYLIIILVIMWDMTYSPPSRNLVPKLF